MFNIWLCQHIRAPPTLLCEPESCIFLSCADFWTALLYTEFRRQLTGRTLDTSAETWPGSSIMATFCCCCCDCVMSSTSIVLLNDVINVLGDDERCVHTCWHLRRTAPDAAPGQCSGRASLTSRVCWWWLQVLCRLIYDTFVQQYAIHAIYPR